MKCANCAGPRTPSRCDYCGDVHRSNLCGDEFLNAMMNAEESVPDGETAMWLCIAASCVIAVGLFFFAVAR